MLKDVLGAGESPAKAAAACCLRQPSSPPSPNSPSANLGWGELGCRRQHAAVFALCVTCPPRSS